MLHYLHNESGEDHAERGLRQGRIAGSWGNLAGVPTDAAVRADLMASARQHHIRCASGEIAPWVLLPGDPARAERIGGMLDAAVRVAANREFTTYTGLWNGAPVSVTSTGIGCPSAAIAVEELIRCGATMLVRVGTSGSMQPDVAPGDFVVATAAVRDEGTSRAYIPTEFPAVADPEVALRLRDCAAQRGARVHLGIMHSKDSFYGQKEPDSMPIAGTLKERWGAFRAGGALCSEMESSTIFVVSTVRRARAGSICLVASSHDGAERIGGDDLERAITTLSETALDAAAAFIGGRQNA